MNKNLYILVVYNKYTNKALFVKKCLHENDSADRFVCNYDYSKIYDFCVIFSKLHARVLKQKYIRMYYDRQYFDEYWHIPVIETLDQVQERAMRAIT